MKLSDLAWPRPTPEEQAYEQLWFQHLDGDHADDCPFCLEEQNDVSKNRNSL